MRAESRSLTAPPGPFGAGSGPDLPPDLRPDLHPASGPRAGPDSAPDPNADPGRIRARLCARLDALTAGGALGLAVSGGGDSAALLEVAARWAAARPDEIRIEVATVDHRLRAAAAAEAAAVARRCAALGLRHETLVWSDPPRAGGNLPARARAARYDLLADWARRRGLAAVALGHTLDDQAETLLLRLARGSALDGLSAMAETGERLGMRWLRPMLTLRRADLRALLRAAGRGWIDDPSNDDPAQDRVRMRRALAALAPLGIDAEGLAATAARLRAQRAVLEDAGAALIGAAIDWGAAGEARLDAAIYAAARADTRYRALGATLGALSRAGHRPRQAALAALDAAILARRPGARTLQGCLIAPGAPHATLCREPAALPPPVPLGPRGAVWDRRWRLERDPADGGAPGGERLESLHLGALGDLGLAALRAARTAQAWRPSSIWRAAPRPARFGAPALWRGERLLAVPGAGYGLEALNMRNLTLRRV